MLSLFIGLLMAVLAAARPRAADTALAARIAVGEQAALRELYDTLAGRVRAMALRVLGNSAEADDVVQETFVEVWQKARAFDEERGSLAAWVTTIAHHRAVDRVRRRGPVALAARGSGSVEVAAEAASGLELVEVRETRSLVQQALGRLSEAERAAVELMYFDGLSQSEVAARLEQPLGTIKGRVRAAMGKLGQLLDSLSPAVRA